MLFLSTMFLVFNVQPVKGDAQTVYINADGSITPVGVPIVTFDNVTYTFTGNISYPTYNGIVVQRSNIVIDGSGYTVQGASPLVNWAGIDLRWPSNVTIRDTQVQGFPCGINLESSSDNTILDNNVTPNKYEGIEIDYGSDNLISQNNVAANYADVYAQDTTNLTIANMTLEAFNNAILLESCSDCIICGNNVVNGAQGINLWDCSNNIICGNNVTENTLGIYLWWSWGIYGLSPGNIICGNNVTENGDGIELISSSGCDVVGNNLINNWEAIALEYSSHNMIYHNNFIDNTRQATSYSPSGYTWDDGYPSGGNYWSDYATRYSNASQIDNSGIWNTPYILDVNNQDNYPLMNPCATTPYPIIFDQLGVSPDFTGTVVTIDGTSYDARMLPAMLYGPVGSMHSFAFQSPLVVGSGAKEYDWASTNGLSALQSDSIKVTELGSIVANYITRVHDVAVTNVAFNRAWVYQGFSCNINVTVLDKGDFSQNVTVALYYNRTSLETIGTQSIILLTGENGTISFVWDTEGVPYDNNYTLTAVATILPADYTPADNKLSAGPITVRILGDINGDGKVDGRDITIAARAFGTRPGNPRWNPDADINGDGRVDGRDITMIARNFGK
jgi:parallel beta-helix repeat protein